MKKIFLGLAFVGLLSFAFPTTANAIAPPCESIVFYCGNGHGHGAICCEIEDYVFFYNYYCGH